MYADALPEGYQLDTYRIRKVLGRGGFGITYIAEDLELNALVAIKEYMPNVPGLAGRRVNGLHVAPFNTAEEDFQKYRQQFRNEAQTLAAFDHPNIVRVRRLLELNSTTYYVMDFVEGQSLEVVCLDQGPLPSRAVMLLAEKLLEGLSVVHQKSLIHRDIKPANIMLARLSEPPPTRLPNIGTDILLKFGRPILIDFGTARSVDINPGFMTGIGTPGYSPKEQSAKGVNDSRSDIYALAATLYRCLAGEPPINWTERLADPRAFSPAAQRFYGMAPRPFLEAIDRGLAIEMVHRPPDVRTWRRELFADQQVGEWSTPMDYSDQGAYPASQPHDAPNAYPSGSYPNNAYPSAPAYAPPGAQPPGGYPSGPYPSTPYPSGPYPSGPYPSAPYPPAPYPSGPYPSGGYPSGPYPSAPQSSPQPYLGDQPRSPGGGSLALIAFLGLLVLGGAGAGAWWFLLRAPPPPAVAEAGQAPTARAFEVDNRTWTRVSLAQLGIRSGQYAVHSDGPFRVRMNGRVFLVDGEGGVDLTSEPSLEIELKSVAEPRRIIVAPSGQP